MLQVSFSLILQALLVFCSIKAVWLCGSSSSSGGGGGGPPPNKPPEFTFCPSDFTGPAAPGDIGAVVTWEEPTVKDPDAGDTTSMNQIEGLSSGSYFTGLNQPVRYKVRDSRNADDYCFFTVSIEVTRCSDMPYLQYGSRTCSGKEKNVHGSQCTSICDAGYQLSNPGTATVTCNSDGQWDKSFPTCQPVSCGDPGTVAGGHVDCQQGHVFQQSCTITCNTGYRHSGAAFIRCGQNGAWSPISPCVDSEPPRFVSGCPGNQQLYSGPLRSSVTVTWLDPDTTDNSGQDVTLTSVPARGSALGPGTHIVKLTATDGDLNSASCSFVVSIRVRSCEAVSTPSNSQVTCTSSYVEGSECTVSCKTGYQIQGQATLTCLNSEQWNSAVPTCEGVDCPALTVNHGSYQCPNGQKHPAVCILTCDPGFVITGTSYVQCSSNGSWTTPGVCQDVEPPVFPNGCPNDIDTFAARLGQDTLLQWTDPDVTDNSGGVVQLVSDVMSGSAFSVGVTHVTYTATDVTGNNRTCSFRVTVNTLVCAIPDLEAPNRTQTLMIYDCPDGYVHGASCTLNCTYGYPLVGTSTITCERDDTSYPPTMLWEWSGPSAVKPVCTMNTCPDLTPPEHGALACHLGNFGWDCLMSCKEPWDVPARVGNGHFYCPNSDGYWIPGIVPNCTAVVRSKAARLQGDLFYFTGDCSLSTADLQQKFIQRMNNDSVLQNACLNVPSCVMSNVKVTCGAFTRRKRSAQQEANEMEEHHIHRRETQSYFVQILFEISVDLEQNANQTSQDAFQRYEEIRTQIRDTMEHHVNNGTFDFPGIELDDVQPVSVLTFQPDCPEGTMASKTTGVFSCVGCSKGYYLPDQVMCQACPVGSYTPLDNATSCMPCPPGWSTPTTASHSVSQCKELCVAGTASPDGFVPCQPCRPGHYQSRDGALTCDLCPPNTWTPDAGANSSEQCVPADLVLTNTSTDFVITESWTSLTVSLWIGLPVNGSVIVSLASGVVGSPPLVSHTLSYDSTLPHSSGSRHMQFVIAPNISVMGLPQNMTVLTLNQNPPGTTTVTVQTADKKVIVHHLAAYGRVLNATEMTSLAASCTDVFEDNLLSTWSPTPSTVSVPSTCDAVDECMSGPCGSHGVCDNQQTGFQCHCQDGWSGLLCDQPPDACHLHQCQNGANCVSANGNYTCTCPPDYTGNLCQSEIVDGAWGEWDPWTQCSATCGGQQQRQRSCSNPAPQNGGQDCAGNDTETRDCGQTTCSNQTVGTWSQWSPWTTCSATCGGGEATRQRTCNSSSGGSGAVCGGDSTQTKACSTVSCPVHGGWSSWSVWSTCNVTCGYGTQSRERSCDNPVPAYGGDPCSGSEVVSQICNAGDCPSCSAELGRPVGGRWSGCTTQHSPFFEIRCTLACFTGYVKSPGNDVTRCGEVTNYLWSHEINHDLGHLSQPPPCLRASTLRHATYTQETKMEVGCDVSTSSVVSAIGQNIDNSVACVTQEICTRNLDATCITSGRKRNAPFLRVSLVISLNSSIGDYLPENDTAAWTAYLNKIQVANDSLPDDDEILSLFTVQLPNGQTVTPDMTSIVSEVTANCPVGHAYMGSFCVECPAGSMEEDGQCVLCPLGQYQDQSAATTCQPCPSGLTWDVLGATSVQQCVFDVSSVAPGHQTSSTSAPTSSATTTTSGPGRVDPDGDSGLALGVIVGLVVGILVILLAILAFVCFKFLKAKEGKRHRLDPYTMGSRLSWSRVFPSAPETAVVPPNATTLSQDPPAYSPPPYTETVTEMASFPPPKDAWMVPGVASGSYPRPWSGKSKPANSADQVVCSKVDEDDEFCSTHVSDGGCTPPADQVVCSKVDEDDEFCSTHVSDGGCTPPADQGADVGDGDGDGVVAATRTLSPSQITHLDEP